MTTTAVPYDGILTLMSEGGINFISGDATVALTSDLYVPSPTGHTYLSDITDELTDPSYARVLMTGKSQTTASSVLSLFCADTTFPSLIAASIRYVIFAIVNTTDADSPLLGYWDLGANQSANVNDFKVVYHAQGFLTIAL